MKTETKVVLVISTTVAILILIYYYLKRVRTQDLPTCHDQTSINYIELTYIELGGHLPYLLKYWDHVEQQIIIGRLPLVTYEAGMEPLERLRHLDSHDRINRTQLGCGIRQYYNIRELL